MVDTPVQVRQKDGWVEVVVRGVCAPPSFSSDAGIRVELVGARTLEINQHPGDPTACIRVQLPLDVTADGTRVKLRRKTCELRAFLRAAPSGALPTPPPDATDSEGYCEIETAMSVLSTGEAEPQQTPCERAVADARGNGEWAVAAAAEALHTRGWTVLDDFVHNVPELLEEVQRLQAAGLYTAGRIGTHNVFEGERSVAAVRGDQVVWIDTAGRRACPAADELLSAVDAFVLQGLVKAPCTSPRLKRLHGRTDAMLACYPGGGAKYTKHIDNTARDGRRLSVVCYLNSDWQPAHGGCLRLHPMTSSMLSKSVLPGAEVAEARVVEVEPVAGRLVAFFADEMLHEVSRTFQPRHALTLWFYDCDERRRAAARRGAGEETMAAATTTIGGPDPPVDAGDAGDDALGEVMQLLQMLAQEDAIAPSREATGRFVERVRELTPHGQRVMAWLLELNDGELAHGLEHLTVDAFGMFVRGAARALGSMQSRAR